VRGAVPRAVLFAVLALCAAGALSGSSSAPRYSADGLYNLANAYARAGKPGLAVLNYERAALLAPGDADINANLQYVQANAHVAIEREARVTRLILGVPTAVAAWIGVIGIAFLGGGLLVGRVWAQFGWIRAVAVAVGTLCIALTVWHAVLLWPRTHAAVILVAQTPARVSPVPMGDPAFTLPEAETVSLIATHEDYALIRTRAGLAGWVALANLGAVLPQANAGHSQQE
jgi:hypothetical protein